MPLPLPQGATCPGWANREESQPPRPAPIKVSRAGRCWLRERATAHEHRRPPPSGAAQILTGNSTARLSDCRIIFFFEFYFIYFLYSRFLLVIYSYILVYTCQSQSPNSSHHRHFDWRIIFTTGLVLQARAAGTWKQEGDLPLGLGVAGGGTWTRDSKAVWGEGPPH